MAQQRQWVTLTNCQLVTTHEFDADSFRVRSGTNEYNVRLYFVDAPESNLRYPERTREQAEYFGLTIDDTIKAGVAAAEACRKLLEQPFVVKTRWAVAGGRTREPRYYCIVEVGGTNLAELLVAQGWARTKGVVVTLPTGQKAQDYIETLLTLENKARQTCLGAWANSTKRRQQKKNDTTTGSSIRSGDPLKPAYQIHLDMRLRHRAHSIVINTITLQTRFARRKVCFADR